MARDWEKLAQDAIAYMLKHGDGPTYAVTPMALKNALGIDQFELGRLMEFMREEDFISTPSTAAIELTLGGERYGKE